MLTRLSLILLIVVSGVTLARAQGDTTLKPKTVQSPYQTTGQLQKYRKISAVPDPRDFFRGYRETDRSLLWKVHLALQLVKRPDLNEWQVRIILDAISVSTPEFFASSDKSARTTKADETLQSLKKRALSEFPKNEAASLFAKRAGPAPEDDLLKLYYDFSALPLKKRKASFRNASSNVKSDLWRTHLALSLVTRSELSARQTEIILAAMSLATDEHFRVLSTDLSWKAKVRDPLRSLEDQIVSDFAPEDASQIFATLGDDAAANQSARYEGSVLLKSINYKPLSDTDLYKQWAHTRFSEQGVELERSACQCSTESDWCPMSSACTGGNCNSTQSGCGTFWTYPCNGASCQ